MAEYVYPALFHPNSDGSVTVTFPDLPGCITEGKDLPGAVRYARSALSQWVGYLLDEGQALPAASSVPALEVPDGCYPTLVSTDVKDSRAVRRTVSIPKWMDDQVSASGLSLSRVLQEALADRFRA